MDSPTNEQVRALFHVLRKDADDSGFGGMIEDDRLWRVAQDGAVAVVNAKEDKSDEK